MESKIIYVNSQHGKVTLTYVCGAAGETYPVLEVNGIELGVSASEAMAGFFDSLSAEDNPWQ